MDNGAFSALGIQFERLRKKLVKVIKKTLMTGLKKIYIY